MGNITPKFHGKIVDGKIIFNNEIRFFQYLKGLAGEVYVMVGKEKKTRSIQQNNYYWAYLTIISQDNGDNPDDLHEFLKRKLLPPRIGKVLGKEFQLPTSTTMLSKQEFSDYVRDIEILTGIPAPSPEEYFYQ